MGELNVNPTSTRGTTVARAFAFVLTFALLATVQLKASIPMLIPERFFAGGGWAAAILLAVYAAWLTGKMLDVQAQPVWRRRAWTLFSIVFFAQLALGLAGLRIFLMSGELHLPVPAVIIAGPIYRGAGYFMLVLFTAVAFVVGPGWCSHLCYVGSWDSAFASRTERPRALPSWARYARVVMLVIVVGVAVLLRAVGASSTIAAAGGAGFGIAGVAIMGLVSRSMGTMFHCTVYCPIGLCAQLLGKLSIFRLRLGDACDGCGACSRVCRYDALKKPDIERRRPSMTCTLCGDCVSSCRRSAIDYGFILAPTVPARTTFVVLITSLHAVFMGVARM